jgi:hypothetical protein
MPRHARGRTSRFAAILTTGVVAGLPLLPAGPAAEGADLGRFRQPPTRPGAQPASAAAPPEISFSRDGLEALSCNSRPSDSTVTVSAESTVSFRNRLGEDATLRIDGRDGTRVRAGAASEVLFHRGTVLVQLVPDCGLSLSSKFQGVSVTVAPAAPGPSSGVPGESGGRSPAAPSSDRTGGGAAQAGADRRSSAGASASASPSGAPVGGAAPSGAGVDRPAGPGDHQAAAAEPLSPAATSGKSGPNGLLAIIAIVCIVGVLAGVIRAIFAQRATRTSAA